MGLFYLGRLAYIACGSDHYAHLESKSRLGRVVAVIKASGSIELVETLEPSDTMISQDSRLPDLFT